VPLHNTALEAKKQQPFAQSYYTYSHQSIDSDMKQPHP